MRKWFGNDWNWIVAGLASAAVIPVLTFGLDVPILIAGVIGVIVFAGLVFLLAPRRLFDGLDEKALGRGRMEFVRELMASAVPAAERLEAASERISDRDTARRVRHLAEIAADVFARVEASPESAGAVRRFLSYYLPRAAELAEGFAAVEAKRAPDSRQLQDVGGVLVKLEDAFVHYADSLVDEQLEGLNTDLRLIQASLKEDLER